MSRQKDAKDREESEFKNQHGAAHGSTPGHCRQSAPGNCVSAPRVIAAWLSEDVISRRSGLIHARRHNPTGRCLAVLTPTEN